MTKLKPWLDVYSKRYDWANSAHHDLMTRLDPAVYQNQKLKDVISVVVYGATQTGKTALILELLGINHENSEQVKKILRGHAKSGTSATVTATRYIRSEDDHWKINDKILECEKDVETHFAELRKQMEKEGENFDKNCLDVYIPGKYFSKKRFENRDIVIRDLPGTHAYNDNERAHVSKHVSKFIRDADIVILACKIGNFGNIIEPASLVFEELKDWRFNPLKFKVVLTHSFSNESINNLLQSGEIETVKQLQQYCESEINIFDRATGWKMANQLFLLDIGETWKKIKDEGDRRLICLRDAFLNKLRDEILEAVSPLNRLRFGSQLENIAEAKKNEFLERMNKSIEETNKRKEVNEKQNNKDKEYLKSIQSNCKVIEDKLKSDSEDIKDESMKFFKKMDKVEFKLGGAEKSVAKLQNLLSDNIFALKTLWVELTTAPLFPILINSKNFDVCPDYRRIHKILKDYWTDGYWSKDNYKKDYFAVEQAFESQKKWLREKSDAFFKAKCSYIKDKNQEKIQLCERQIEQLKNRISIREKSISKLKTKISNDEKLCKEYCQQRDDEIEYSKEFSSVLKTSFQQEQKQLQAQFYKSKNHSEKLYFILLMRLLRKDFEKIGETIYVNN